MTTPEETIRLCCSRCGAFVTKEFEPGRCFDEQGEPQESDTHDIVDSEVVVWGEGGMHGAAVESIALASDLAAAKANQDNLMTELVATRGLSRMHRERADIAESRLAELMGALEVIARRRHSPADDADGGGVTWRIYQDDIDRAQALIEAQRKAKE